MDAIYPKEKKLDITDHRFNQFAHALSDSLVEADPHVQQLKHASDACKAAAEAVASEVPEAGRCLTALATIERELAQAQGDVQAAARADALGQDPQFCATAQAMAKAEDLRRRLEVVQAVARCAQGLQAESEGRLARARRHEADAESDLGDALRSAKRRHLRDNMHLLKDAT